VFVRPVRGAPFERDAEVSAEMKELPQVTIGEIKEDAEIDWRSAPDDDGGNDSDPTSAPTWLIQLLGFDPFQEEAEGEARADRASGERR
jgi:hypothetical protein